MGGEGEKEQGDMWHVQPGKLVYELDSIQGRKLMLMALHEITNYTRACVFCIHNNMSRGVEKQDVQCVLISGASGELPRC